METFLLGAVACTAFDVVLILQKARQPVADCVVTAEAERAEAIPRVFTKLHLVYTVAGRGLDRRQVERAVKLSKEKYCSATAMLAATAAITYEVVVIDGDAIPPPTAPATPPADG
jgi:putative redox protein